MCSFLYDQLKWWLLGVQKTICILKKCLSKEKLFSMSLLFQKGCGHIKSGWGVDGVYEVYTETEIFSMLSGGSLSIESVSLFVSLCGFFWEHG